MFVECLDVFGCKELKDIYYSDLAKGVKYFKEEGGRKLMCEAVKKYAEIKRIDALYETIKNLMETMKLSAEQAMSAIKVSENDREILLKRL